MTSSAYQDESDPEHRFPDNLPSRWQLLRLKHMVRVLGGGTPSKERDDFWEGTIPWVSPRDMKQSRIEKTLHKISAEAQRSANLPDVPRESVLLVVRGMILAHSFPVAIADDTVTINQDMKALTPSKEIAPAYLALLLAAIKPIAFEYIDSAAHGTKKLDWDKFRNIVLPVPPLAEQRAIAEFLDHETARIDALIEEQQRLIDLLKEDLHTSLAASVTNGLDPTARKRETGLSDLPTIPEHWRLTKAKFLIREFEQGWSPQCENAPARNDSEWAVLKVGAVNRGVFRPDENKRLPEELKGIPQLTVRAGDLLVSRANTRELVGSAAVADRDHDRLMVCDKLYRIRLDETACVPAFLSAYLQTQHPRREIEFEATGASSSMLNIGQDVVRELLVPTPPADEQKEIVDWITERQHKNQTLINSADRSIELLRERRQATISAAVTGKIDVRDWYRRMSPDERELPCSAEEGASYG